MLLQVMQSCKATTQNTCNGENFIGAEIEKRTYDISKHNINEPKMCA
jgi:hypothetical protein